MWPVEDLEFYIFETFQYFDKMSFTICNDFLAISHMA